MPHTGQRSLLVVVFGISLRTHVSVGKTRLERAYLAPSSKVAKSPPSGIRRASQRPRSGCKAGLCACRHGLPSCGLRTTSRHFSNSQLVSNARRPHGIVADARLDARPLAWRWIIRLRVLLGAPCPSSGPCCGIAARLCRLRCPALRRGTRPLDKGRDKH